MQMCSGTMVGCLLGSLLGAVLAPQPAPGQALTGFDVFRSNCGGCHELPDPEAPKRTAGEWETILTRMVNVRGAALNKQEFTAILKYLGSFDRPHRQVQWVETPAKSHKATLSPADAGKLPPQWVDLTLGTDAHVPWAVQGDPAARTACLAPLKTAGENQFPALLDNSGNVQSGSIAARLQILSGKGRPGAGILFGFRSQSYFGVRIGPGDVVLYEVEGGQRALLARASAALPLRQWHSLMVEIAGKNVTVTLNGKPVPELSRTLPSYRGGKVGMNTQEDTMVIFDQWQVEVR